MNQTNKLLKVANSCTIFDSIDLPSADIDIKNRYLNALINRLESKHTQQDVANRLGVSKRTVIDLESGKVNNIVTIFNYIHHYGKDNAQIKLRRSRARYYKNR